jgi:uncharacterized protein (TIGR03435 family)
MTLRTLISVAYGMPPVRIEAPEWLSQQTYAVSVVANPDAGEPMPSLLRQELIRLLDLRTHTEQRELDIYVLRGGDTAAWKTAGRNTSINVEDGRLHARDTDVGQLAEVLQNVAGKPILDETGIKGSYNFELIWGETNKPESLRASLDQRYGMQLTAARRSIDVLVVDRAEPNSAMSLMSPVGWITSILPGKVRRHINHALAVR